MVACSHDTANRHHVQELEVHDGTDETHQHREQGGKINVEVERKCSNDLEIREHNLPVGSCLDVEFQEFVHLGVQLNRV